MKPRYLRGAFLLVLLTAIAGCGQKTAPPVRTVPTAPPAPATHVLEHTVREGENLSRIADLYYGDPGRAENIARHNGITDPAGLQAGAVLLLDFAADEWDDARRRGAALEPYNQGGDALAREDLVRAEREFRLALQTAPELVDARYNLALVLMRRGQHPQATELLTPLAVQRPNDPEIGFALGSSLFQQALFEEAIVAFAHVLQRYPDNRRAAFGHARSLQESGRVLEARAAWNAYLALDPSSSWADAARRHLRELPDD